LFVGFNSELTNISRKEEGGRILQFFFTLVDAKPRFCRLRELFRKFAAPKPDGAFAQGL
jgi:hypothetical protein